MCRVWLLFFQYRFCVFIFFGCYAAYRSLKLKQEVLDSHQCEKLLFFKSTFDSLSHIRHHSLQHVLQSQLETRLTDLEHCRYHADSSSLSSLRWGQLFLKVSMVFTSLLGGYALSMGLMSSGGIVLFFILCLWLYKHAETMWEGISESLQIKCLQKNNE